MHTLSSRAAGSSFVLILAALVACGDSVVDPRDDDDGGTVTSVFRIESVSPADGATDVSRRTIITVDFSQIVDQASVDASAFSLSPDASGERSVSGRQIRFTPDSLDHETTYTVRVTTAIRSADGSALSEGRTWSFGTPVRPTPPVNVPLEAGRQWRYSVADTSQVFAVSTGASQSSFVGERFVRVTGTEMVGGRQAARVVFYDFNDTPSSSRPAIAFRTEYLHADATGLWRHTQNGWRQLVSFTSPSIPTGTFLMTGGPRKGNDLDVSVSSASVPAGSYSTLRARHTSSENGQYATEHWTVSETEHWADGVGLVSSTWNNFFDDKDPMAADVIQRGYIRLTHMDTGPFPNFLDEAEGNDSADVAEEILLPRVAARGAAHITDGGALFTDSVPNCPSPCVHPNEQGQELVQDWYRLVVTASQQIRMDLVYDGYDFTVQQFNDLDLYLFADDGTGGLVYVARSTRPQSEDEVLSGTITPGTYYLAVQAWKTRGSAVEYLISVR